MHRLGLATHRRVAVLALVAGMLTAACGGSSSGSSTNEGTASANNTVTVVATQSITFGSKTYSAKAGTVNFAYDNHSGLTHTLLVENQSGFKLKVNKSGDVATGSLNLPAGQYVLYCDVPGHRAAGMEAKLNVS